MRHLAPVLSRVLTSLQKPIVKARTVPQRRHPQV
jgi:hypothetical protein